MPILLDDAERTDAPLYDTSGKKDFGVFSKQPEAESSPAKELELLRKQTNVTERPKGIYEDDSILQQLDADGQVRALKRHLKNSADMDFVEGQTDSYARHYGQMMGQWEREINHRQALINDPQTTLEDIQKNKEGLAYAQRKLAEATGYYQATQVLRRRKMSEVWLGMGETFLGLGSDLGYALKQYGETLDSKKTVEVGERTAEFFDIAKEEMIPESGPGFRNFVARSGGRTVPWLLAMAYGEGPVIATGIVAGHGSMRREMEKEGVKDKATLAKGTYLYGTLSGALMAVVPAKLVKSWSQPVTKAFYGSIGKISAKIASETSKVTAAQTVAMELASFAQTYGITDATGKELDWQQIGRQSLEVAKESAVAGIMFGGLGEARKIGGGAYRLGKEPLVPEAGKESPVSEKPSEPKTETQQSEEIAANETEIRAELDKLETVRSQEADTRRAELNRKLIEESYAKAEEEAAPDFEMLKEILPIDETGDPDVTGLPKQLSERYGKENWNELTAEEKLEFYNEFAPDGQEIIPKMPKLLEEAMQENAETIRQPDTTETTPPEDVGILSDKAKLGLFRDALQAGIRRQEWRSAVNATPEEMQTLIDDGLKLGLLRKDRDGVIRRSGKYLEENPEVLNIPGENPAVMTEFAQAVKGRMKTAIDVAAKELLPEGIRVSLVDEIPLAEGGEFSLGKAVASGENVALRYLPARDRRIVRQEAATLNDDGSVRVGRQVKSLKKDTIGKQSRQQKPDETRVFKGLNDADGRVTAIEPSTYEKQIGIVSKLTYRFYDKGMAPASKNIEVSAILPKAEFELKQHQDGTWEVDWNFVDPRWRRQGVATRMHDAIEKDLGMRHSPSGYLTDEGLKFWQKRSPESVRWHQKDPRFEGMYVSPRYIIDEINGINGLIREAVDPNVISRLKHDRGVMLKMWLKLPPEARVAADDMLALGKLQALGQTDPYNLTISLAARAIAAEAQGKGVAPEYEAVRVFAHEVGELHKAADIFTEKEWKTLERAARKNKWADQTVEGADRTTRSKYEELYKDKLDGDALERTVLKESIFETFSEFYLRDRVVPENVRTIFTKVKDFIERVKNFLRGEGFNTYEDVFLRIEGGEFKRRLAEAISEGKEVPLTDDRMLALRGFYSPATRAAEKISMKKGTGEQFWKQITKTPGVKRDELEWMGLEEFLKGKESVTKDEVLEFMDAHKIELDEKIITESLNDKVINAAIKIIAEKEGTTIGEVVDNYGYINKEDYIRLAADKYEFVGKLDEKITTSFSSNAIQGGINYRELLIRFPELEGKYRSQHFQDQEIVHVRMDDRIGQNGEKILFINEIQSDLHQSGRRLGYKEPSQPNWTEVPSGSPPEAPFKGDLWLELALKRTLRYAVENGYDAVSWARSDQIAKAVGQDPEKLALQYDQKIPRFLEKYTKKWDVDVFENYSIDKEIIANSSKEILDRLSDNDLNNMKAIAIKQGITGELYNLRPRLIAQLMDRAGINTDIAYGRNKLLRITPQMRASVMEGQPYALGSRSESRPPEEQTSKIQQNEEGNYINSEGYILKLPYKNKWGNPRMNSHDSAKAESHLRDIQNINVKHAKWEDLVRARNDIREILAQLYFYEEGYNADKEPRTFDDVSHYAENRWIGVEKDKTIHYILFRDLIGEGFRDVVIEARLALNHLLSGKRRGLKDLLIYGNENDPSTGVNIKDIGKKRGGFYFDVARKIDVVPDDIFNHGGQAVIDYLQQAGISRDEIKHFNLNKLSDTKPASRAAFKEAIAERLFEFRKRTSWLNPERTQSDYDMGGTRAFRGPRIPGRGIYFERLMAFPKKLKGGEEFPPGFFKSPHWEEVHKGTWASWRGSIRDISGWDKVIIGEEGQSDYMQGALTGKRKRISTEEYKKASEYEKTLSTPESPIDKKYVRTMVRDLLLQAAQKDVDSIAISTSETSGRIQNNEAAAHFYDNQLRRSLEKELRRLSGDDKISLEKIALPKAIGAPRNERPYTVWIARLSPKIINKIKSEGVPLFAVGGGARRTEETLKNLRAELGLSAPTKAWKGGEIITPRQQMAAIAHAGPEQLVKIHRRNLATFLKAHAEAIDGLAFPRSDDPRGDGFRRFWSDFILRPDSIRQREPELFDDFRDWLDANNSTLLEAIDNVHDVARADIAERGKIGVDAALSDTPSGPPEEPSSGFRGKMGKVADYWQRTFQPELVSDFALQADAEFARFKAATAQERDSILHSSERQWEYWNKVPVEDQLRFIHDIEIGAAQPSPELAQVAARYRGLLDQAHRLEALYGSKAGYFEDYFPHIWKQPDKARSHFKTMETTHQLGPRWFQKARYYDLIAEGRRAGLELKSTNPQELINLRLLSGADMRMRMELLNNLKEIGVAREAKDSKEFENAGWEVVNAPNSEQWLIAPDIRYLWKNAVEAKGLWGREDMAGSIFRGWMAFKNVWVPVKLTLSMFHPLHVYHINMAQNIARGWGRLTKDGDLGGAIRDMVTSFDSRQGVGYEARMAWEKTREQRTDYEQAMIELMEDGGFVPQLSEQLRINAKRQFQDALDNHKWGKLLVQGTRRGIEKFQARFFERWIPGIKAAAYIKEAQILLARRPELLSDPIQRRVALRTISKSIDNRFGEMFYGGLFWNRTLKDSAIGSFLSLGWNLGFVREFGGAAVEPGTRLFKPYKNASQTRKNIRDTANKKAFVLTYVATAMLWNGVMNYLFTGEVPDEKDVIFPRIGGTNPDGTARRVTNMFYTREVPMIAKHIEERQSVLRGMGEMLWNKTLFQPFVEMSENRTYWGYEIWDEQAPWYNQWEQLAEHIVKEQLSPITVSGAERVAETSGTWKDKGVPLAFLGFGPAPGYVERTPLENRIRYLYQEFVAPLKKPYARESIDHEKRIEKQRLLRAVREGDLKAASESRRKLRELGAARRSLTTKALLQPTSTYLFSRLQPEVQDALLQNASPEEVNIYRKFVRKSLRRKYRARVSP